MTYDLIVKGMGLLGLAAVVACVSVDVISRTDDPGWAAGVDVCSVVSVVCELGSSVGSLAEMSSLGRRGVGLTGRFRIGWSEWLDGLGTVADAAVSCDLDLVLGSASPTCAWNLVLAVVVYLLSVGSCETTDTALGPSPVKDVEGWPSPANCIAVNLPGDLFEWAAGCIDVDHGVLLDVAVCHCVSDSVASELGWLRMADKEHSAYVDGMYGRP